MFKAARWRSDKNKIKAVFKLQFQATQVPQAEWDTLMVFLVPLDSGKPTAKSEKARVRDGACNWENPIYETVKFSREPKSGKLNEKAYNLLVSSGSSRGSILGEAAIDFAAYAEAIKPSPAILHLKSLNSETILHVTIQRIQSAIDGREEENGDSPTGRHIRTLKSQLSNGDTDGSGKEESAETLQSQQISGNKNQSNGTADGTNVSNITEVSGKAHLALPCSKFQNASSRGIHRESSGSDVISGLSLDSGSEQNTPRERELKSNNNCHDVSSLISSLSNNFLSQTPQEHRRSNTEWSVSSGPDTSTDSSTNGSESLVLKEKSDDSDISIEKLKNSLLLMARQAEVSELELQTLRKQIVKECTKGHDLLKEVRSLKEERDALKRECEHLRASKQKKTRVNLDNGDPHYILEEIREELDYEKELNVNLRLQLQKTQESNSELILAVKDLEESLEQKSNGKSPTGAAGSDLIQSKRNGEGSDSVSKNEIEEDEEQQALEELVRRHDETKAGNSLEQSVLDLSTEIEVYRKDKDELEMQMEQLALDYEILKQENHEISSKLEQMELQEKLKMHYESSSYFAVIDELETHIQTLQNEIEKQAESFEADISEISRAKVEQEQRATRAEEALRKVKWNNANTAERLQEEFRRLSTQMYSTFEANEKLAMQAQSEACELLVKKNHLEELLEKASKELELVKDHYRLNLEKVLHQVDLKEKEINRLVLELQKKIEEVENQKEYSEAKERDLLENIHTLKAETMVLKGEKNKLFELMEQKDELLAEMEGMMRSLEEEMEMLLKKGSMETEALKELSEMKHFKDEKEEMVFHLRSEMENIRRQYKDLKHFLFEDELEKENLRKEVLHLRNAVQKKEDAIAVIEKKLKEKTVRVAVSDRKGKTSAVKNISISPCGHKDLPALRKKIMLLEGGIKLKQFEVEDLNHCFVMKEKDLCSKIDELEKAISEHGEKDDMKVAISKAEDITTATELVQSDGAENAWISDQYFPKQSDREEMESVGIDLKKEGTDVMCYIVNQDETGNMICEMALLMQRNKCMETELKEMQERYSEISLKFAEVEGERQQLVMTIRNLRNAMKC